MQVQPTPEAKCNKIFSAFFLHKSVSYADSENAGMNFQKILVPAAGVGAVAWAYPLYGWTGVAAVSAGGVMWLLLHFTRMMQVLKRAANRPIGYVDSAVMLNAKLKPGMTLLQVVAMTRALGERQSEKEAQPEVFGWSDDTQSQVTCTFVCGKLTQHALFRLEATDSHAKPAWTPSAP